MRLGICNELFEGWSWDRTCAYVAELGYHGIEIAPFTLGAQPLEISAEARRALRRSAEKHGLAIIGLHWLLAKTSGLHLTSADREQRGRTRDYLVGLARLCADLGGAVLVFGSPAQRRVLDGISRPDATHFAAEVIEQCLPTLESANVVLALEPLGPQETNFLNTADEVLDIMHRIGSPYCRLHLDVKAMSSESHSFRDIIWRSRDALVHFHANDPNLLGPGMGNVDYREILPALRDIHYRGWLSVEVFDFSPGPEPIAAQSIQYLRRALRETLDDSSISNPS